MSEWAPQKSTGALILKDGTVFNGFGCGFEGKSIGEVCFNTAMTGYQEIMTDPSYTSQIITFTFPHIGNVGINSQDIESNQNSKISGVIFSNPITSPSNWRSEGNLNDWLIKNKIVGLYGIDTRDLTNHIRKNGFLNGIITNDPKGVEDKESILKDLSKWKGINGQDLAKIVSTKKIYIWKEKEISDLSQDIEQIDKHIVVIDYGVKSNILRCLSSRFNKITVVPCETGVSDIKNLKPDGIFLSNGPGDPVATGEYAIPIVKKLISMEIPIFGICLGHQILALALGGETFKMHQGHHGANHPVKNIQNGKVEITSMNHGFAVNFDTLPSDVEETHKSLFDGSNSGLMLKDKPIFSIQHHPESSPGPYDSFYLFNKFQDLVSNY
jgi:carbamoyl-phosphate synthase small subunit